MKSVQPDFSDEPRSSSGSSGDYLPVNNHAKRKPPVAPRKYGREDNGGGAGHTNGIIDKVAKFEFLHYNNSHHLPTPHPTMVVSPKVFRADSVTVNAPAKDVLGIRSIDNLTKKHQQMKFAGNGASAIVKNSVYDNVSPAPTGRVTVYDNNNIRSEEPYVNVSVNKSEGQDSSNNVVVVNNLRASPNKMTNVNQQQQNTNLRIRTPSPSFNRNPQNVVLKHTVQQLAAETLSLEGRRQKAQLERIREQENERLEQDRLEEILMMCAEYEKQNANFNKQTVPNRIKTNGSLSRDKKSPYCTTPTGNVFNFDVEFTEANAQAGQNSYENIRLRGSDQRGTCYENVDVNSTVPAKPAIVLQSPTADGPYENVYLPAKPVIPNSPRTRIKTYLHSPKKETTPDNEHSLELKLLDVHNLKELHFIDSSDDSCSNKKETETIEFKNTLECEQLKKQRHKLLDEIRRIKTKVTDIQSQEEELFREVDMEEALLSAEYDSETALLTSEEQEKALLQEKIRVLETNREKVKEEQDQIQMASRQKVCKAKEKLQKLELNLNDDPRDAELLEELKLAQEALENERKNYEDLEFQYLEEETDWMAQKEELHNKVISLSQRIDEKKSKLKQLDTQKTEVFNSSCKQTRMLEQNQIECIRDLEINRNLLKDIDLKLLNKGLKIYEISSDLESEDELLDNKTSMGNQSIMSMSLYGVEFNKTPSKQDPMSMSMNENILRNNIEYGRLDSGYISPKLLNDTETNSSQKPKTLPRNLNSKSELDRVNGIVVYNCNNIPKEKSSNINISNESKTSIDLELKCTQNSNNKLSKQFSFFSPDCLELIQSKSPKECIMARVPSQDDIDRISKVTSKSPICTPNGGSKAEESLRQIEKNRQLLLQMKGSQVIESERQRVSELKLRIQSEVRAKWEQTHPNSDTVLVENNCDVKNSPDVIPTNKSVEEKTNEIQSDMKKLNVNGESDKTECVNNSDLNCDASAVIKRKPKLELIEDLCKDRGHSLSSIESQHSIEGELDGISNESGRDSTQLQTAKEILDTSLSDSRSPTDSGQLCNSSSGCEHSDSLVHLRPLSNVSDLSSSDTGGSGAAMVSLRPPTARSSSATPKLPKNQRPLTRYLPISSDRLDLREHILAAGHQLDACPHVRVDSTSCRGYLQKLSSTKWHGWSRRWFAFDRMQRAFVYYTDKAERKPRGGAYFQAIDEVYMDHSVAAHNTFIVKTRQRHYRLLAPSSQAARIWIDAICTGAMGNMAYLL